MTRVSSSLCNIWKNAWIAMGKYIKTKHVLYLVVALTFFLWITFPFVYNNTILTLKVIYVRSAMKHSAAHDVWISKHYSIGPITGFISGFAWNQISALTIIDMYEMNQQLARDFYTRKKQLMINGQGDFSSCGKSVWSMECLYGTELHWYELHNYVWK
jgi:hypothetical protein